MNRCCLIAALVPLAVFAAYSRVAQGEGQGMCYPVHRLDDEGTLGDGATSRGSSSSLLSQADWDHPAWRNIPALELTHFMGVRPDHFPRTQVKLLYDDAAIYLIFRVEDRYVRAVAQQHHDPVCRDSCVEFFFSPADDTRSGYFNLEMNCGGTMLFHYQRIPRKDPVALPPDDLTRIEIAHSLPKIIDPEISESTPWTVEYRLPLEILKKYYPALVPPAPNVIWRANFYKCADSTSHPHWLTWSSVVNDVPDFHIPRDFGKLQFR